MEIAGKAEEKMRAVTLLYHDVVENGNFESSGFSGGGPNLYKLDVVEIRRHFEAVSQAWSGRTSTAYDLLEERDGRDSRFLLTFDDGGVSAATLIADLLDEFRWIGHFFITTDYIGTPAFVNAKQIRQLRARGHLIGSHSCSHPARMSHCSWDQLVDEWGRSRAALSDILGEPVEIGSIPGGYYSRKVADAAFECGIKALFTSEPVKKVVRFDDGIVVGRYSLHRNMPPEVSASLASDALTTDQIQQFAYWNLKKAAKAVGGKYFTKARRILLRGQG